MDELIRELVEEGIEVTLQKDEGKLEGFYYDLNLMAKSHLHLYRLEDGSWEVGMRYGETQSISDLSDLMWAAKSGMQGRDYISSAWRDLLIKNNVMKEVRKTSVTYE